LAGIIQQIISSFIFIRFLIPFLSFILKTGIHYLLTLKFVVN